MTRALLSLRSGPTFRGHVVGLVPGLLIVISGCICGPDFEVPDTPIPDAWHQTLQNGNHVGQDELGEWWRYFEDPQLNDLIERAGKGNLTLYQAAMRICQARTQVCIANSARLFRMNGTSGFTHQKQSANLGFGAAGTFFVRPRDIWSQGFDMAWEPDVFGRVARSVEAADMSTCAEVEAYRDVLVTLYGDVAQYYVTVRTLQAQLDYARRNVKLQQQSLELVKKRVDGGVSPILDLYQAESNVASTEATLPPLEAQLQESLNRIAVLLGEYPGALHGALCPVAPIPTPPATLPIVVPCDMVRQRPDIRAAERRLAARSAEVGVAIAELYPRFAINGTFALQAQKFSDVYRHDSEAYNVGPSVNWPIFRGFQIRCNIERTTYALDEALSVYESSVLLAFEEVENSIQFYNKELKRRDALKRTVEAAEKSLESVLELYRGGKTNFQNVLDTQRTLFLAQNALAVSEGQIVINLISMYKALGGGWDPHHHCEQAPVRLRCPDRADPALCDAPAPSNLNSELLPDPKSTGAKDEDPDQTPGGADEDASDTNSTESDGGTDSGNNGSGDSGAAPPAANFPTDNAADDGMDDVMRSTPAPDEETRVDKGSIQEIRRRWIHRKLDAEQETIPIPSELPAASSSGPVDTNSTGASLDTLGEVRRSRIERVSAIESIPSSRDDSKMSLRDFCKRAVERR